MIENLIPNFIEIYLHYSNLFDRIENQILNDNNDANTLNLLSFQNEFKKFDTKLRLGISITDITLDDNFVRRKMGELKDCHLYFYKLSDIWFAYDAFFKFYYSALDINLSNRKIIWLDDSSNSIYSNDEIIISALQNANEELNLIFDNLQKRRKLVEYLNYCKDLASGGQVTRLNTIIPKVSSNGNFEELNHTDFLTIAYSIRNNFVHNGEVTIYPENFNYILKSKLLKLLYKYLVVITVKATSITINEKLNIE